MNASLTIKLTTTCLKECVRKIMIAKDSLNNDVPSREVRAIRLKRLDMCWLVSFSGTERQRRASIISLLTSKRWWVYFVL
jgi:hypothetical protein